jgi:hypothetical protein
MTRVAIFELDSEHYARHALHAEDQTWVEKNCYIDVWIEVVHALGLEPLALMPFTVGTDFESDQWTFFKPPHTDLRALYGIDVQELNVFRPLLEHSAAHVRDRKLVLTEADAFYLPDTQGTDYKRQHTKTTIAIESLDVEARRLGYFHNAGYFALEGEDFDGVFRTSGPSSPDVLPLFVEFARIDRVFRASDAELRQMSSELLKQHLAYRPRKNPFIAFSKSFGDELERLTREGLDAYHLYAFATIRQLGASFDLLGAYLSWLASGDAEIEAAAHEFTSISSAAKTLVLKAARAVNAKKPFDVPQALAPMQAAWDQGMTLLTARYPS